MKTRIPLFLVSASLAAAAAPHVIHVKPGDSLEAVRDQVRALPAAARAQGVEVVDAGGDDGLHGAVVADVAHQLAGVDALDGDDVVLAQEAGQVLGGAEVARALAHVAHDKAAAEQTARLHVLGVDAVVADLRVGHGDDLARVRRVAQDLLVPGEAGVEADLAKGLTFGAAAGAAEESAVLQQEHGGLSLVQHCVLPLLSAGCRR